MVFAANASGSAFSLPRFESSLSAESELAW